MKRRIQIPTNFIHWLMLNGEDSIGQDMGFSRHFLWLFLSTFLWMGCAPSSSQSKNVILILAEGLGEESYVCSESFSIEPLDFLSQLCPQFSRYTRAFAPSTMTQPNLATIFTGLAIKEHGVFHNGAVAISGEMTTLAEIAIEKGYRTGFFSGGLPVLNKFGIHHGYEVFNDGYAVSSTDIKPQKERKLKEVFGSLGSWVGNEVGRTPFFATIYLPGRLGMVRESSRDTNFVGADQFLKWQESLSKELSRFLQSLENAGQLKNTHIVIAGLSGSPFSGARQGNSISSAKTHVALQIRPADGAVGTTSNELLSLKDIFRFVTGMFENSFEFPKSVAHRTLPSWISIRSDWGVWKGERALPELGFRRDPYFVRFDPNLKIFNSFTDFQEQFPLAKTSKKALNLLSDFKDTPLLRDESPCFIEQTVNPYKKFQQIQACQKIPEKFSVMGPIEKFLKIRLYADQTDEQLSVDLWKRWVEVGKFDEDLPLTWLIQSLVQSGQWQRVLKIATKEKFSALLLVAKKNLKFETIGSQECLTLFEDVEFSVDAFYKNCGEISLLKVVEGLRELRSGRKAGRGFWTEVQRLRRLRATKNRNIEMNFINDVYAEGNLEFSLGELYFYLPKNKNYLKLLK